VITMNIIPEVIIPLLGEVVARLAEDGRLILSGILVVKRDEVVEAARAHGLSPVSERTKGEWWAGVLAPQRASGCQLAVVSSGPVIAECSSGARPHRQPRTHNSA
jgi:hypothetical protein